MRAAARPEAVAVLAEGGIKNGLQHLQQRLLDQTIRHRRDAKLALASLGLGDRHPSYRTGPVRPRQQLFADRRPLRAQLRGGLVNVQTIHTGYAFVPAPASTPVAGSLSSEPPTAAPTLCPSVHAASHELHRCPSHPRIHRVLPRTALLAQASDAMLATSAWRRTLSLVRPFACGAALQPSHRLLQPRLTSRSGSTPSPFRA